MVKKFVSTLSESNFNSIKVRLEHWSVRAAIPAPPNFNSIKVRLELRLTPELPATFWQFQFHKGTIRTIGRHLTLFKFSAFQFHKGTIRTVWSFFVG